MKKKTFGKELFVLWISLGALVLAAMSLNKSLNKLVGKE